MKILAPFSSKEEIAPLAKAGAEEFYCGVVDAGWEKKYSFVSSINLRHDRAANLSSLQELKESIETANSFNAKVFLTLNAHFYSEKQLPLVMEQAEQAVKAGVDSLIVADAALVEKLSNKFDIDISVSTGNPVFNNAAIDFFKELGAKRIVFPRHLTVPEIGGLAEHAKKAGLKTECFVLNVICPYIDGLCTLQHIVDESISFSKPGALACRLKFNATALGTASDEKKIAAQSHASLWNNSISRDCGLCALSYFKKFGIETVKIAGRAHSIEKKLADVKAAKKGIEMLRSGRPGPEQWHELYFELFHNKCDYKNCYYPGVGFGEN